MVVFTTAISLKLWLEGLPAVSQRQYLFEALFPFSFNFYTVVFPNYQEDETLHRETLENLGRSPSAEKHMRMVLAMEGLEGPNTQGEAERFMAVIGHHLEEMMATYHSLGIAGKVAGKSSNT